VLDPNKLTSQSLAGRLLRLPLRLIPDGLDVPVVSGPNRGLKWRTGSSVHGCWLGTYERDKVELLSRFVKPGMVAYDIGANAGYYTLLLSRLVGPSGKVYSFEPLPANLVNLTHHVLENRLANCHVVQGAASDRDGLASFQIAASSSMGSIGGGDSALQVSTFTLDSLVAGAGLPPPDFVKLDVEGAEGLVLAGAVGILRSRPSTWFVALHGESPALASVEALVLCGFEVFDLDGGRVDMARAGSLDEVYAVRTQRS
jgi:FkbM family methyltransferase